MKFHVGLLHGKKKYGGGVGEQRAKPGASEHRSSVLLLACCFGFVAWNAPFFLWELLFFSLGASGSLWAASGKRLAAFWEAPWKLGSFWEASLEASGKPLGASGKLLETFGKPLGSFWEASGSFWDASGKLLIASRKSLESFETLPGSRWEASWKLRQAPGSVWEPLEASGQLLEASGKLREASGKLPGSL